MLPTVLFGSPPSTKVMALTLGKFLGENRTKLTLGEVSISAFFSGVSYVNEARTEVETIEGLNLSEITNINQL